MSSSKKIVTHLFASCTFLSLEFFADTSLAQRDPLSASDLESTTELRLPQAASLKQNLNPPRVQPSFFRLPLSGASFSSSHLYAQNLQNNQAPVPPPPSTLGPQIQTNPNPPSAGYNPQIQTNPNPPNTAYNPYIQNNGAYRYDNVGLLPPSKRKRGSGEMVFLYGAAAAYGVSTGIWFDALVDAGDVAIAMIPPLILGAGAIVGTYFWDKNTTLHRGVAGSTALGVTIGMVEGFSLAAMQAQNASPSGTWSFTGWSTATWLLATGGGVGGYFFGEYYRPDPRALTLIVSGGVMGALSGFMIGGGASPGNRFKASTGDWKDGATVGEFIGLNVGLVGLGALATQWTPSWRTMQWMWIGYAGATAVSALTYVPVLAVDGDYQKTLVVNGLAGIAGAAAFGALTANLKDDEDSSVTRTGASKMPVMFSAAPMAKGGAMVTAFGQF